MSADIGRERDHAHHVVAIKLATGDTVIDLGHIRDQWMLWITCFVLWVLTVYRGIEVKVLFRHFFGATALHGGEIFDVFLRFDLVLRHLHLQLI